MTARGIAVLVYAAVADGRVMVESGPVVNMTEFVEVDIKVDVGVVV